MLYARQHALARWAYHTRYHRLPGRSFRAWAPKTNPRHAISECRIATVRRVHGASGSSGENKGTEAPIRASLFSAFSPSQFHAFVRRYGPVALGTTPCRYV